MRTLFEVLRDIMNETPIEFIGSSDDKSDSDKKGKGKKTKISTTDGDKKSQPFSGVRILNMSPEKTVLVYLRLAAENFTKFECNSKTGSWEIGVNLLSLNKLLKSADNEDELVMYIDKDDIQSLVLSVNNSEIMKRSELKLKLMDIGPMDLKPPPIEYDVDVTMNSNDFHKLCKDMAQLSSSMEIRCTKNTIVFMCEGYASRATSYTASNSGVKIQFSTKSQDKIAQGVYELKHLNQFSKCASLSPYVQLLMKVTKYPLCIKYSVATLGTFVACITPKEATDTKNTFEDAETLYQSDDDIELKKEFEDETKTKKEIAKDKKGISKKEKEDDDDNDDEEDDDEDDDEDDEEDDEEDNEEDND
jgi:proliferating cell nuclear antigen